MADVARFGDDDRGQLVIVMSLLLALLIVAMVLYLNTAIYAENLGTQESDVVGAEGASSYKHAAEDGTAAAMAHVNEYNATDLNNDPRPYDELEEELEVDMNNWSDGTSRFAAVRSRSANVSVQETNQGERITQDEPRNFSAANHESDWTVVEETDAVRNFEVNVSEDGLPRTPPEDVDTDGEVHLEFDDGQTRQVYFHVDDDEGTINATVFDGGVEGSCGVDEAEGWATFDLTGGEVVDENGETVTCSAFDALFDELDEGFEISYNDASDELGTYELIAEEPEFDGNEDEYFREPTDGSPYKVNAIYAAEIDVTYQTARIDYATIIRVAPGEPT